VRARRHRDLEPDYVIAVAMIMRPSVISAYRAEIQGKGVPEKARRLFDYRPGAAFRASLARCVEQNRHSLLLDQPSDVEDERPGSEAVAGAEGGSFGGAASHRVGAAIDVPGHGPGQGVGERGSDLTEAQSTNGRR
jgi:hypothetical protein